MNATSIINKLKDHKPFVLGHESYREYSVLLPLVEKDKETHILFEVRSMNLRSQPGDICFPGGKVDEDDPNEKYSAIRETSEELGIDQKNVQDVIPLDYIVSDFGRIVYSYIGKIVKPELIKPNKAEVAEIFTVPLNYFLKTEPKQYGVHFNINVADDFPIDLIQGGKNYNWQRLKAKELFYVYEDKVIWGLTARIVDHFIQLVSGK